MFVNQTSSLDYSDFNATVSDLFCKITIFYIEQSLKIENDNNFVCDYKELTNDS